MYKTAMSKTPLKTGEALYGYIPQRPPFVMVDKMLEKGDNYLISGFYIETSNVLCEDGKFKEGGLVENIAQTAALFAGTKFVDQGKEIPVGYIAGIKDLFIHKLPAVGEHIVTKTTLTHELMNIQIVTGEIFNQEDEKIAECELRIFIKEAS